MDAALAVSALLMGLAGGPHCVAMCGVAFGAIAKQGGTNRTAQTTLSLHVGRLIGYSVAGACVAASVSALGSLQAVAPLLRPVWTLVHVGAVALGLWLVWKARAPVWLSAANPRVAGLANGQGMRVFRRLPGPGRAVLAGACWTVVPCGLLQSALLVAALASGPAQGAAVMATFASASALSLWLGPHLWSRLRSRGGNDRLASSSVRLAGALLATASLFALSHGLGSAIEQALCRVAG